MIIDYSVQKTFSQSIDIVDAGNCGLRCGSDNGDEYYIITKTMFGKTGILSFGPVMPEANVLFDGFSVRFKKIDYREPMIEKEISKFINDPYKKISIVENCTEFEAWKDFINLEAAFQEI